MTDSHKSDTTLPLKTAIVGAAVGAAAVMLSKKDVRDTIAKNAKKIFDTGEKKLDHAIRKAEDTKETLAKKTEKAAKSLR